MEQISGAEDGTDHCDMELERVEEPSKLANDTGIAGFLMLQLGNSYH